jgi:hypothetical protein
MGIASVLALILVVLKAMGLTGLAWGWCLLGFGVDILLFVGIIVAGFLFGKKTIKVAKDQLNNLDKINIDEMENRINAARDRLG